MRPKIRLLTTNELADAAGVCPARVRQMRLAGKIEAWAQQVKITMGRPSYLYPETDVDVIKAQAHPARNPHQRKQTR